MKRNALGLLSSLTLVILAASATAGCGSDSGNNSTSGNGDGGSGEGGSGNTGNTAQGGSGNVGNNGQGGTGNEGNAGQGGSGNTGNSGQGGAGGDPNCAGSSSVDDDADGFTEAEGDCNDCDANTNPGAVDVISVDMNGDALPPAQQYDEDCDGVVLMPGQDPTCDGAALAIDSLDPIHGANAMDICKVSQNGSWGIVDAQYVHIDGTPLVDPLGHGLLSGFGPNVLPKMGAKVLALSSGAARQPTDPGYQSPSGYNKNSTSTNPPGFPIESPSCPGVTTGTPHDSAALRLTLKVPTNAKSLSFKFKFYTYEFPTYICSTYNDFFVTLMDPPPVDVDPINKNIAFDAMGNPISVNNALLDVCTPGTYGGKVFTCPGDINELTGTGFETHGATAWLQTNAPVTPGSDIVLTFSTYDSGDGVLDSTTLLDDFQWSADPAQTGTNDACLAGGTGTCDICVTDAIGTEGCCGEAWGECTASSPCAGLAGCVSLCNNDVCVNGCYANYPNGIPLYEATLECLYGDGSAASVGACGVVCK